MPLVAVQFADLVPFLTAIAGGVAALVLQAYRMRHDARVEARRIVRHYRDPLLRSAFDLQSRLYNIVLRNFLGRYWVRGSQEEKAYALSSTLWLIGQYLGWVEILRREVQFLNLGTNKRNRMLQRRFGEIAGALATDSVPENHRFVTYRSEQRAIGEFMVVERSTERSERLDCLEYSMFVERLAKAVTQGARAEQASAATDAEALLQPPFAAWVERFRRDFEEAAEGRGGMGRLVAVQRQLIGLIDDLDPERIRYPDPDMRGRLPAALPDETSPAQVASFVFRDRSPWTQIELWAGQHLLVASDSVRGPEAGFRSYTREKKAWVRTSPRFEVTYDEGRVTVHAWIRRGRWADERPLSEAVAARRARRIANDLLEAFDRPLLLKPDRWLSARRRSGD